MGKVLVIHHLEPEWAEGYIRIGGITFEKLCKKVAKHIKKSDYSRVILTQFSPIGLHESYPYEPLIGKVDEIHEYGYGWEASMFADGDNGFTKFNDGDDVLDADEVLDLLENETTYKNRFGTTITLGGYHSQVVVVEDWMFELAGHEVDLCGAFDGECIEDMQIALSAAGVKFNRINALII